MRERRVDRLGRIVSSGVVAVVVACSVTGCARKTASVVIRPPDHKATFNDDGDLVRPQNYRRWVYVGTPLTPHDMNDGKAAFPEFHSVYIDPVSYAHYRDTGTFPNGTTIVKELVSVGGKNAVSGNGYFMGEFVGLEVTVKDRKRFPREPGGWVYFSFGHEYPLSETAKPLETAACNACHEGAAEDDFVFTQYYPVLRAAKGLRRDPENVVPKSADEATTGSSDGSSLDPTAPTPEGHGSQVPTDKEALFQFLVSGKYKEFVANESRLHPGRGPHTQLGMPVRVYLDPQLDASLKSGADAHPVGAAAVKEMFDENEALQGWAVMVKTNADSADGKGWFWYEVTNTQDGSEPIAAGNGVPLCSGCHSVGEDFVLTNYPLR